MNPDEQERILTELDDFVDSTIGFDELTEFILDCASIARDRDDLSAADAVRLCMESYRVKSTVRHDESASGPGPDSIVDAMSESRNEPPPSELRVQFGPCCFCGREIEGSDVDPCSVTVTTSGEYWQVWSCHGACFRERLLSQYEEYEGFFDPAHF